MIGIASLAAAVALAASTAAAPPADEAALMRDFFANTLRIDVLAGNWSAKRYYAPDHTYGEAGDDGDVHGTWRIEDGKLCATQTNPPPDRLPRYCNLGPGKKLGEVWNDTDPQTGNTVVFGLIPGR